MTKDWIQTASGRKMYPLAPDPNSIVIEDIAAALSKICRYTGHVSRFLSVAEHSVWVSRVVEERAPEQLWLARWGLLHDATEAYIADVSRPLKYLPAFDEYRRVEAALSAIIIQKFGLPPGEPPLVKQVDAEMLGTEVAQLMQPTHPDWDADSKLNDPIPSVTRLGENPHEAERMFLARFAELRF